MKFVYMIKVWRGDATVHKESGNSEFLTERIFCVNEETQGQAFQKAIAFMEELNTEFKSKVSSISSSCNLVNRIGK